MLYVPFTRRTHEWQQSLAFGSFYDPRYLEYVPGFADQKKI